MVNGKWVVSPNGDLEYDNGRYNIYDYQLDDEDWILHMLEKNWCDMNDFIPAYFKALKIKGTSELTIQTFY